MRRFDRRKTTVLLGVALFIVIFWGLVVWVASAIAYTRTYATCYNLHGTMADGSYTRSRSVASNHLWMGTHIRLVGRRSYHGYRKFVVRDTGSALYDGHLDIWYMGFNCSSWGRRAVTYKIGWARP